MSATQLNDTFNPVVGTAREALLQCEQLAAEVATLARLNDLSSHLMRTRVLNDGLNEMLTAVMELLSADKGTIQLLDRQRHVLRIVAHRGFQGEFLHFFREVQAGDDTACGQALRRGERTVIEDVELEREYAALRPVARAAGYRALVSTPLIGADGTCLGMVTTHFSEPHRPCDQELRRLDLYLRQASDFIQRCQLEEVLRRSQEALLEADQRKDEFLALLAHELRNPLAPIRYAIASIRNVPRSPRQRAHAEQVIERQVAHMSRLLDDLLEVSRITMGRLELKKEFTELNAVLDAAVEAARPSLDAKGHALVVDLPEQTAWLSADVVRLIQVFSNLLINAARYTDAGGLVELSASVDEGNAVVRVRDSGVGIAPEMLPRLFAPFRRGGLLTWRADAGLGVGLSLARGLINLHGGSIEAFSEGTNRGSEFVVRLPVTSAPVAASAGAPATHEPAAATSRRVLLVDDNRDAADTCATLLELAGHDVRMSYTGRTALELAQAFLPQVVVLDIGLPDIDGYEVARLIRAADWGKDMTLVAVTGWGRDDDKQRAFAAGFNHHLVKPVAGDTVLALLRSLDEPTLQ